MAISKVEFSHLRVPLVTPFVTAVRRVTHLDDLVVKIVCEDGRCGFGSAPSTPLITGETHATIQAVIESHIFPALQGMNIDEIKPLTHTTQNSIIGNTSAKAAIEIALYDLWAQQQNLPLFRALGGTLDTLQTDYTISVNPLDTMMKDCQSAIDAGYQCLKIKVGSEFEQDLKALPELFKQFSPHATLRLDVNQGWNEAQTINALLSFEKAGVHFELVEQPIPSQDISGMARVSQAIETPVMADESATTLSQVESLLQQNAADIVNIKLMKCGGISQAIAIAQLCQSQQRPCMMGCMLEGAISVAAAAHVVAAFPDSISLVDLDGPTLGQYDPLKRKHTGLNNQSTTFDAALIRLNGTPGLGIRGL